VEVYTLILSCFLISFDDFCNGFQFVGKVSLSSFFFYCRSAPEHNYGTIVQLREGCRIVDNYYIF